MPAATGCRAQSGRGTVRLGVGTLVGCEARGIRDAEGSPDNQVLRIGVYAASDNRDELVPDGQSRGGGL